MNRRSFLKLPAFMVLPILPTVAEVPASTAKRWPTVVHLYGDTFNRQQVMRLIEQINEAAL